MWVLTPRPGYAVVLADISSIPALFSFTGWGGFIATNSIITGIATSQAVNGQFSPTMLNLIYAYFFGDRMGEILISGLSFPATCGTPNFGGGIRSVLGYYNTYRASRSGLPISVAIGNAGLSGFVMGMGLNIVNPETQITQFVYRIMNLPPTTNG